jgi:hypothetical protein
MTEKKREACYGAGASLEEQRGGACGWEVVLARFLGADLQGIRNGQVLVMWLDL